jgi:DNA topoisomerase VI subunit B
MGKVKDPPKTGKREPELQRATFETYRDSEYFTAAELQTKTGQPREHFADVVLKELLDNGADAAEMAGVAPVLHIGIKRSRRFLKIYVRDNGPGIPPGAVESILNFRTKTSDKAAYPTPTRGLQGNALKTIVGMSYALGQACPIVVEGGGTRHLITASLDPAGEARIERATEVSDKPGTRFTVTLPISGLKFFPGTWARSFSLFNPHAVVKILEIERPGKHANCEPKKVASFYRSTVDFPGSWSRFLPTELPSPWWFDGSALNKLAFSHIGASRRGARDLPLREFVQNLRGLSSNLKAKQVCDIFQSIRHLSDFEKDPGLVGNLLAVMQKETKPPSPAVLGCVGESHFRTKFQAWFGVKRFWYRKVKVLDDGVPYVFEVAVAHTRRKGAYLHGVNFSPSFDDPFVSTFLDGPEFSASSVASFLEQAHAHPRDDDRPGVHTAVAVHITGPRLQFLDQGKTRLSVPDCVAERITAALWLATKTLYREQERRKRDAAKQARADRNRAKKPRKGELRDSVFEVLPEALRIGTGDGEYPISAHTLYYKVRPLIQPLTSLELTSDYFEQSLLPLFQRCVGTEYQVYYEPRGILHEPHTRIQVPLGTREVEAYVFPDFLYDKILFIEKKGLWPVLEKARLGELFDMAIIAGEGYASEACRVLFSSAHRGVNYQLFVVHDADPYGYNILRTLSEETSRMPGYSVEVVDLGLKLGEGLALGLQTEEFTRKKALPKELILNEVEREHFEGQQVTPKSWLCRRIELNAFSSPDLIAYLKRNLESSGVRGKVIPPDERLQELANEIYRQSIDECVDQELMRLLQVQKIKNAIAKKLRTQMGLGDAREWITTALAEDRFRSWRGALTSRIETKVGSNPDLQTLVLQEVIKRVKAR